MNSCLLPDGTLSSVENAVSTEATLFEDIKKVVTVSAVVAVLVCNVAGFASTKGVGALPNTNGTHAKIAAKINTISPSLSIPSSTGALSSFTPPDVVFSLLTDVATRLVNESKQLDRDFAMVVEKEFWNILQ
jgi:hypothetical protein